MFQFFKNLGAEWRHIVWPSRGAVVVWTASVIIFAILIGYYLGALDIIFSRGLFGLVNLFQK